MTSMNNDTYKENDFSVHSRGSERDDTVGQDKFTLEQYLTREVLPRMDNYRMSIDKGRKPAQRPTIDDLLSLTSNRRGTLTDAEQGPEDKGGKAYKLGWMKGVLMKCMLNIWGVMLYLRLTWVVGQAGLVEGLLVIAIANIVTLITAMSMSAVCTNGAIKAGGVYYMISRNLGPEFGGAIGLMFFLANSIAVSMYLIGFCESLLDCLEQYGGITGIFEERLNDIRVIGIASLVAIFILAIVGMDWITRVQVGLLGLLIISQVDFVIGTFIPPTDELKAKGFVGYNYSVMQENLWSAYTENEDSGGKHDFFSVFAVFFPAVTGIVAGANMSGDLKDPSSAIPKGTLLAIGVTCVSYLVYAAMTAGCALRAASGIVDEVLFAEGSMNSTYADMMNVTRSFYDCEGRECKYGLLNSQQMMEVMSAWGPLIYAGCFAATLSSAIGSLEGAPRVFQAISKDKLLPGIHYFAKGRGANNDPIRGYFLVTFISLVCLVIGNLNIVSSLLSNFFVAAYGLINFCVFHACWTKSPSWRPKYKYYNKWVSLVGTILCIIVMFMMDWKTALVTYVIIILLCLAIQKNHPDANWGSSTQSQVFLDALKGVQNLSKCEEHIKNYRPKILLFSGNPSDRSCLVDFANLITKRLSLLQCVNIVDDKLEWKSVESAKTQGAEWLQKNQIKAFYSVSRHQSFSIGARSCLELWGIGKLKPNMVLIGFKENWQASPYEAQEYYSVLQTAFEMRLSVGILRISGGFDISEKVPESDLENLSRQVLARASLDSGLDEMKEIAPSPSSVSPPLSDAGKGSPQVGGKAKTVLNQILRRNKSDNTLVTSAGTVVTDESLIKTMTQFRSDEIEDGFIDVYWLFDDGGLAILMPYILMTRKKFGSCKFRVFALAHHEIAVEEERQNMVNLLKKFRIKFDSITMIADATNKPGVKIRKEFNDMIKPHVEDKTQYDSSKTNFHLRIAEIVREHSKDSSLILMTLPIPKKDDLPPVYMTWLDIITKEMPPFLLIRGNQESVLTFYS